MPSPLASKSDADRLLKRATYASVATAVLLIAAKTVAWIITGSVSVLASLLDSLMDAGASLVNLLAVRYSLMPPDDEHRFGHGKTESVAGLAQATFIAGSGVFLLLEAVDRLIKPVPVDEVGVGVSVMVFSIIATLLLLSYQNYVIRKTGSTAIKADALHYKTDLLVNAAIIASLLLSSYGWGGVDPLFAMAIGGYILYSAWQIGVEAFHQLIDRELPDEQREQIEQLIRSHPEVHGFHDLRTRLSGRIEMIQLHLEMDDDLPLLRAHAIADEVEHTIKQRFPHADVVIHQDPVSAVAADSPPASPSGQ